MNFRTPIFVQAGLGKNAQPVEELCARWNLYGETLTKLTEGKLQKIVIFLPISSETPGLTSFENLDLKYFQDTLSGRFLLIFQLQRQIHTLKPGLVTLIAGDLYISPLISRILKMYFKKIAKVQIQFHGASYKISARGIPAKLKYWMMKSAVSSSDSIRIVSAFQRREIESEFNIYSKNFIVSPIPISLDTIPDIRTPHHEISLLVLGRLHPERGIDKILELIEMLEREKIECIFDVVGDGSLKQLFEPYIIDKRNSPKVILHGPKAKTEVKEFLAKSDLLISLAQEEGYGLALREAILSGVHVLAKRNSGTEEVLSAFPGRIDLIESTSEAFEFIRRFRAVEVDPGDLAEIRKTQEISDAKNIEALVVSWIEA